MDDIVFQAIAKWPNVPACYGWLGLDARGEWWLRDYAAQALGRFPSIFDTRNNPQTSKGSKLSHSKLVSFIARNYASDEQGRWYFQNGPQRVFVDLEATPWIWRLQPNGEIQSHGGNAVNVKNCLSDELGHLYLETDMGFGLVHTQDTGLGAHKIDTGEWPLEYINSLEIPTKFRYVQRPMLSD